MPPATGDLQKKIDAHRWYHTLELAPGVLTPGWFDTRSAIGRIPFPADLTGKRCLDVGTFDGFWAFEMEKRGAADVTAIDITEPQNWDWPHGSGPKAFEEMESMKAGGSGFDLAAEALGSTVKRLERSVYDLDPAADGLFDFVYVGSLLLHLRDPIRAIERVRSVAQGTVLFVDAIDWRLSLTFRRRAVAGFDGIGRPWWWKPNAAGVARMVRSGGFTVLDGPVRFAMRAGKGQRVGRPPLKAFFNHQQREPIIQAWYGDPHAAVVAKPA